MIVLDTNVLSELMRSAPDPKVLARMHNTDRWQLYTTSISIAEIAYGIALLPDGNRRQLLRAEFDLTIEQDFSGMILPFTIEAAEIYGTIRAYRKLSGRSIDVADAQIAAIAKVHGAAIATRNIKDFVDLGVELINPYE